MKKRVLASTLLLFSTVGMATAMVRVRRKEYVKPTFEFWNNTKKPVFVRYGLYNDKGGLAWKFLRNRPLKEVKPDGVLTDRGDEEMRYALVEFALGKQTAPRRSYTIDRGDPRRDVYVRVKKTLRRVSFGPQPKPFAGIGGVSKGAEESLQNNVRNKDIKPYKR